jgi:branched-chain amino acid transport system permease protein
MDQAASLAKVTLNAMQLAAFYLPIALAFAILQAITRRVFLSFGDLAMYASYAAIYVCFHSMLTGNNDPVSIALSFVMSLACGAAIGMVAARIMFGPKLFAHPMAFMIASVGLSIALQEMMRLQSGSRDIWIPPLMQGEFLFKTGEPYYLQWSMLAFIGLMLAMLATAAAVRILTSTSFGRAWRACSDEMKLAALCGIDAGKVAMWTFGLAGALSGVTGWTSAIVYGGADFSIGLVVGFKAMFASVIGGFGTLRGAFAGAILLAVAETVWTTLFSYDYRDVAVFAMITAFLILRPQGLLGRPLEKEQT